MLLSCAMASSLLWSRSRLAQIAVLAKSSAFSCANWDQVGLLLLVSSWPYQTGVLLTKTLKFVLIEPGSPWRSTGPRQYGADAVRQGFLPHFSAFKKWANPAVHPIARTRRKTKSFMAQGEREIPLPIWVIFYISGRDCGERISQGRIPSPQGRTCLPSIWEAGSVISRSLKGRDAMPWKQQSPWAMLQSKWKWNNGALHSTIRERVQAWYYTPKCFSVGGKLSQSITAKWTNKRACIFT